MFGSIGKLICAALAVLCFGYSGVCLFTNTDKKADAIVEVKDCNVHPENEGKIVMLKGKLTYNNGITEDPETGVRVKTPCLVRLTEMYQYKPSSTDQKTRIMTRDWYKDGIPSFTDKYKKHYSNPSFPSDVPRNKDFACELTVNNGNLKIDAAFAKVLSYGKYVTFKDTYSNNMKRVSGLPSKKLPKDFVNGGNVYYRSYNGTTSAAFVAKVKANKVPPRIGDVRITYKAFQWNDNMPEFTVIGQQKNGKIMKNDGSFFYDYRIEDQDQLKREVRSSNRAAMFGALVCGVLLAAAALFI